MSKLGEAAVDTGENEMPSWWANQAISLFGNLALLNRDDFYPAWAIGRAIGRFKVDFICNGLIENPIR